MAVQVPVVIIGGGGCGLTLSALLSDLGVEHYLFERHSGTSILPKAHYLNQRSMEILRQYQMDEEVLLQGTPPQTMSQVSWLTSLGGTDPLDRKVLGRVDAFGAREGRIGAQEYKQDSAARSANLPLIRLEPILLDVARKRNPGKVLFDHNVTKVVDQGETVQVTVQRKEDGAELIYEAKYIVGADGGRTIGKEIGVVMEGLTNIVDIVSTHFKADLSKYWDDRNFIAHFVNPDGGTMLESGALVPMGPTWGKKSEEWTLHFGFGMDDVTRFEEDLIIPRLRQLLKIPDLDIKVLKISHWELECVLANKYRSGRIFLAGDSCHRHPPTTGLGLNGAIEDAHNLAWKLALHLSGATGPELLDTYETERRPVGRRNCDWGLFTFMNTAVINAAVGLIPGQKERNQFRFHGLFADTPSGRAQRAQVQRIIATQEIEFRAHDLELGFHYDSGALISDGSEAPAEDPLGQQYVPTTRPGHRLPHAWLQHKDSNAGELVSTHDLIGKGSDFLLLTGDLGEPWVRAAQEAATSTGLSIRAAQIGGLGGQPTEYLDYDGTWSKVSQLTDGGAILVRPDTIVGWRSSKSNPGGETKQLLEVINTILSRPVGEQSVNGTK